MSLVDRAKNIVLSPKTEWEVIRAEPATTNSLFTGYAAILALIPAVCGVIAGAAFGHGLGLVAALVSGVVSYVLGLVGLYVFGIILKALAPSFGAEPDPIQAMKVAVYSATPAWLAGVFGLIPVLGGLLIIVASLYSIYLIYLGVQQVLGSPQDKAIGFTAVAIVIYVVIFFVISIVAGLVAAPFVIGSMAASGAFSGM